MAQALGVSMGWLWGLEGTSDIESAIYTQKIHRLEGKLLLAKKTLKGALEYLEEEIDEDKALVVNTLSTPENYTARVAEDEPEYNHKKNTNNHEC